MNVDKFNKELNDIIYGITAEIFDGEFIEDYIIKHDFVNKILNSISGRLNLVSSFIRNVDCYEIYTGYLTEML